MSGYRYIDDKLVFSGNKKSNYSLIRNYRKNEDGDITGGIVDRFIDLGECKKYALYLKSQGIECAVVKGINCNARFFGTAKKILWESDWESDSSTTKQSILKEQTKVRKQR